ncbi:hypothetical protein JCM10295v2_006950 [Rhodotorula toruloides]
MSPSYACDSLSSKTSTLRAKTPLEQNDFAISTDSVRIVPDTPANQDPSMDISANDEDGIRMVSSRVTAHDATSEAGEDRASSLPSLPMSPPAFVFGWPPPAASPSGPTSTFTFSMPGALFASTSSAGSNASAATDSTDASKSAAEQIMEEMNRRAAEARAAAGAEGLTRSRSALFGGKSKGPAASPDKGSREAFNVHHKRNFAKMDSITNHWAAKRPYPTTSTSSGNIVGMVRSTSSRALTASTSAERPSKRLKGSISSSSTLDRLPSSASNRNFVNVLRDEGWSAAPAASTSVSLSASLRSGSAAVKLRAKKMRDDVKPVAEQEREQRRRQIELAKARRKSQVGTRVGLSRTRPSLGVGPKPPSFYAGGFLKKTFRKLASTAARPSTSTTAAPHPPLPSLPSERRLASDRPTKPLRSPARTPRFAAPTASTSARAISSAVKPNTASPSPKKQPGWKKFDLQESLKRPMSWKTGQTGSSPAVARAGAGASRQVSAEVANPSLLGNITVAAEPVATMSLPSPPRPADAPASATPFASLANLAPIPAFPSTSTTATASSWHPPAITKRPVLPLCSPAKKTAAFSDSTNKKVVSSSTRLARAGEKGKGRAVAGELESRARKVRAAKEVRTQLKGATK